MNRFKSLPRVAQIVVAIAVFLAVCCCSAAGLSLLMPGKDDGTATQAALQVSSSQSSTNSPIPPTETNEPFTDTPQATNIPLATDTPQPSDTPQRTATALPTATQVPTDTPVPTPGRKEAQVVSVIDGDTIEVRIDETIYSLRYIGIDTPEFDEPFGSEATAANAGLVEGQTVYLEKDVSETDQYDRLLRYVYLADGTFVNAELVRQGWGAPVAYPPDTLHQDLLSQMEHEARDAQRGQWKPAAVPTVTEAPATTSPPSGRAQVVVDLGCSQFDAPGNDNDNKTEEWVCFRNTGDARVDMNGWTVRDEHGWTYRFPAFTLSPGSTVQVVTGCGTNTAERLYWCYEKASAVWNNDGDTVYLFDAEGNQVAVQSYE